MTPILSADNRHTAFDHPADSSHLPTTPTIRLLEVTCGLSRDQAEALLNAPARPRPSFPDRPSALNGYQALGVITCGLLLASIVAALIISLG